MREFLPLADSHSRSLLKFINREGGCTLPDIRREFLDVAKRDHHTYIDKLLTAGLLTAEGERYHANVERLGVLRDELELFDPTSPIITRLSPVATEHMLDIRIAGQLYILRNAGAYNALRAQETLTWHTWETLAELERSAPTRKPPRDETRQLLLDSGMVNVGDSKLALTPNRFAELAQVTREILGEDIYI